MHTSRLAITALLLAPVALRAEELQAGLRSNGSWTDNVFGAPEDGDRNGQDEDAVDEFSLRMSPFVSVRDPDGDLRWSLRYQPSYEQYLDQSEISGFDHAVTGDFSWRFAERWTFGLQENYLLNQSSVRFNEAAAPGEEVTLGFQDQEVRSHRTSAWLTHALGPQDSLSLTVGYNSFEYPDQNQGDRSTPSTALAYDHVFSERTTAGFRFSWAQQANDDNVAGNDETAFYNFSGTLEHQFSRTFRIAASAGPTLIDSSPPVAFEAFVFPVANVRFRDNSVDPPEVHGPFAFDADRCRVDGVPRRARALLTDCQLVDFSNFPDVEFPTEITDAEFDILKQISAEVPSVDEQLRPVEIDSSSTDLTYFARLELVKDWEYWTLGLGYQRSNSESARLGSSSVADSLWASLTWRPRPLWNVILSTAFSVTQQASDQAVLVAFQLENVIAPAGVTSVTQLAQVQSLIVSEDGNDLSYRTHSVALRATRQLTPHASAFASANWYSQQEDVGSSIDETTRWNNLTLSVGLEWVFDPIRF